MTDPQVHTSDSQHSAKRKRVCWGTLQVWEFRVGYNACAVPSSEGPPVGLVESALCETTIEMRSDRTTIDEEDRRPQTKMSACWMDAAARTRLLQSAWGFSLEDVLFMSHVTHSVQHARSQSRMDFDVQDAFASGDLQRLKILCDLDLLPSLHPRCEEQQDASTRPERLDRAASSHIQVPA